MSRTGRVLVGIGLALGTAALVVILIATIGLVRVYADPPLRVD